MRGETVDWGDLCRDDGARFNWDLRPSSPDAMLGLAVGAHPACHVLLRRRLDILADAAARLVELGQRNWRQEAFAFGDRKLITEDNFELVFADWVGVSGASVRNGFKPSRHFVTGIQNGRTQVIAGEG